LATHPVSGYDLDDLASGALVRQRLADANVIAREAGIRLSFHPDQFVVLNSLRSEVVSSSIGELEWQAELAELLGADAICLHGGGLVGGPEAAGERLIAGVKRLSPRARSRLALENDDRCFSAESLLPVCLATGVPFILDAHHHRVLPGALPLEDATDLAIGSWNGREPYFHISSPRNPWGTGDSRPHADYIDQTDVPEYWLAIAASRALTIDVEAKAKERAVLRLREELTG
jgi:UV DNA damage endonuclease